MFQRVMISGVTGALLLACQGDPLVTVSLSSQGVNGMQRVQLLEYLRDVNETLEARSSSEMSEYFSLRDAKGNLIRFGTQTAAPEEGWALLDLEKDHVPGTSTERAYQELGLKAPRTPVIVAVIDGGVDIHHEDLAGVIWTNEAEARGIPGRDNDGNGYVGDVHGWNFIGNKDGASLLANSLEVTREVARMRRLSQERALSAEEQTYLQQLEQEFEEASGLSRRTLGKLRAQLREFDSALTVLRAAGLKDESLAALNAIPKGEELVEQARALAKRYLERNISTDFLRTKIEWFRNQLEPHFDLEFDASRVIGDDPAKVEETGYGNPDVTATSDHGTHVSGIIAAIRDNGIGIQGQAAFVRIMPLRVVPDGDERDKDVVNAIRYAVDNGARVINMSFGKSYSPQRAHVEEAIRYAERHGVLIVHAAGNSAQDVDLKDSFPTRPRGADNWIEVGASTQYYNEGLVAPFSNFGAISVDLFAPGMGIRSSTPGNTYESMDGTSMASPEVAGVAALLISQYPQLRPDEVRYILMETARRGPSEDVLAPGSSTPVDFASLSVSGGIVNAHEALKMAIEVFGPR